MSRKELKLLRIGIWWTIVLTAIFTLIAGKDTLARSSVCILCALGVLGLILAMWEHGWLKAPVPIGTPIRAIVLITFPVGLMILLGWYAWPPRERNSFSLAEVAWDHPTVNLGKIPCAPTPTKRVLPDGTCQIIMPPGVLGTALHAEAKMKNAGKIRDEDVFWHGGVVVSNALNDAEEDALFTKLTSEQIAEWPEFEVGEMRTLTIRNEKPDVWDATKVRYLMLRGSFHDESGKRPDVELCKRYGGMGKSLLEADHLDEYCKGHNIGIDLPKPP